MIPTRGLPPVLALAVFLPGALAAQSPDDTQWTKDGARLIGLAQIRPDTAEQRQMFRQAIDALAAGRTQDADNPKFWFLLGQANVGVGDYLAADSAFDRAVAIYPEYADDIEAERAAGWVLGFEEGVVAMEQQRLGESLALFQSVHELYPKRPETLLNISNLHIAHDDMESAEAALDSVVRIVEGPEMETLAPEEQETWRGFAAMAQYTVSEIRGLIGVQQYDDRQFADALVSFRRAFELNPYSRDYAFNIVQSLYAQATALEEELRAAEEAEQPTAEITARLQSIYQELPDAVEQTLASDPANPVLPMMALRARQRLGQIGGQGAEEGNLERDPILQAYNARGLDVDMNVEQGEGVVRIFGEVRNRTAPEGSTATLVFTLVGRDGAPVAEEAIAVAVPAADAASAFEETLPVPEGIRLAGWKYRLQR